MTKELEQEILEDLQDKNLSEYASYLGIDGEDLEEFYYDVEFDDYSR
jgi:hypothetical protein